MEVIPPIVSEIGLFTGLYVLWDIGESVMQRYENISRSVYQLNWYLLPLETQRKLPTILAMAEKNIYLRGFARFHCTRAVFFQVLSAELTNSKFKQSKNKLKRFLFELPDHAKNIFLFYDAVEFRPINGHSLSIEHQIVSE